MDVDKVDILLSFIDPQYTYSFDFIFNDHFLANVDMQKFDYGPYVWSFLFGVFSFTRCYASFSSMNYDVELQTVYFHTADKNHVKFVISVVFHGLRKLHFIHFYLGNSSSIINKHVSKELYDNFTLSLDENPAQDLPFSEPFLHVYSIYAVNDSANVMQLIAKKIVQEVPALVDIAVYGTDEREQYRLISDTECDLDLSYTFDQITYDSMQKIRQSKIDYAKMFESIDMSLETGNSPAIVGAFIHGCSFHKELYYFDEIFVHHQKHGHTEWFNLTSYNYSPFFQREPYMLSFTSYDQKTNYSYVSGVVGHSADCKQYRNSDLHGREYKEKSDSKCVDEYYNAFHNDGQDYLTNFFKYCDTKLERISQTEAMISYLGQIFDAMLPSSIKQSRASLNYLKYFVMGTFVSTEQVLYKCKVDIQSDILVFEPNEPDNPLIIITFNADYQFVSVTDFTMSRFNSSSIVTLSIDEISDNDHNRLSRKSFRREIKIRWHRLLSASVNETSESNGIILKQSPFLANLIEISEDYDHAAYEHVMEIIVNAFPSLYADHSNSFKPFMQGIFHRKGYAEHSRGEMVTHFSKWTCKVQICSNFLFDHERTFYINFLPTLDAAIMFFNSPKERTIFTNHHMTIIYNPKSGNLDYTHHEYESQEDVNLMIAEIVCKMYPDTKCMESFNNEVSLSRLLPQSMSFIPPALLRHLELIENVTKTRTSEPVSSQKLSIAPRSKRGVKKNNKHNSLPGRKAQENKEYEKEDEAEENSNNVKETGSKIIGLINDTMDTIDNPSVESIMKLTTGYTDLGLTVKVENKKVKRSLKSVRKILDMYSLGQDIKNLVENSIATVKAPTVEAALELTQGYANLIDTFFSGGVKLLTHLNVLSKGAWFLGPIGTAISAVSTACSIGLTLYDVGKQLATLCQAVELTTWQIVIEGVRLASGLGLSWEVHMLSNSQNEKNLVYKNILDLAGKEWKFPKYEIYVSSYMCGKNHPCFGSIIELNRDQLIEYTDSRFSSGHLRDNNHVNILCVDGNILSAEEARKLSSRTGVNSSKSYFCHSAFALINNNATSASHIPRALYDLGPHASVKALKDYHNHFRINHDFVILEGGDNDDFFDFTSFLRCGFITGRRGADTIQLGNCGSECELIIRANAVDYKKTDKTRVSQCLLLESIERVIGQTRATEIVFVDCAFSMISLNGGKLHRPDIILLPESLSCLDTISLILSGHTIVENRAFGGSYFYKVVRSNQGNIRLNLAAGRLVEKSHTILMDHMPISEFADMIFKRTDTTGNYILTIIDKSGFNISLIVTGTKNLIQIIFQDGERAEFDEEFMNIIVNTEGRSLGRFMSRYGTVLFSDSIAIRFGSQKFGISIELKNGTIKYNEQDAVPFELLQVQLDGQSSIKKCSSQHTYAVFSNTDQVDDASSSHPTAVTFVASPVPDDEFDEISLMVDFTFFLEYLDSSNTTMNYTFTIELGEMIDSKKFNATILMTLDDLEVELCVLFFDGFVKSNRSAKIRFLTTAEYDIELKTPYRELDEDIEGYTSLANGSSKKTPASKDLKLELIRLPKVFHYHPDYLLILTSNDVHWNEILTFPDVHLKIYDLIRHGNILVLTSIRSNLNKDIFKLTKSFFTIILEDFYVSDKLQSLVLEFGDGNRILTEKFVDSAVFNLTQFKSNIEIVERHLARKDVVLVDKGGIVLKEWMEMVFNYT